MDAVVIGNIVAPVADRRGMHRREPDGVHAERPDVIQLRDQARQVALPIPVRVAEAADVDLVDGGAAPPGMLGHPFTACSTSGCIYPQLPKIMIFVFMESHLPSPLRRSPTPVQTDSGTPAP